MIFPIMPNNLLRYCFFYILFLLAGISGGCAATAEKPAADTFFTQWEAKAGQSRAYSPSKESEATSRQRMPGSEFEPAEEIATEAAPDDEGTPDALATLSDERLPTDRVTLKMSATDTAVILRALARSIDQSIMISQNIAGEANINAVNEPWDKVFFGILKTYGLTYEWIGNILRIKTLEDIDRERELEKAALEHKSLRWRYKNVEEFSSRVFPIDYADPDEVGEILSRMISVAETRQTGEGSAGAPAGDNQPVIAVNRHTNAIIVYAARQDIEKAAQLIDVLDQPTPQILIEAQIVETNRETARDLGVQWSALANVRRGQMSDFTDTGEVSAGFDGEAGLSLGWMGSEIANTYLNAQLSALQQEGKLNILSSPSITTLDNQEAIIESGRDVPFQTVEDDEVSIEFKKAVLRLEVTPHVIDSQILKLKIATQKDELDFSDTVAGNPTIITKNARTHIFLHDGQTTVIGGLNKETRSENQRGIPGLQNIPLLGSLFRSQGRQNQMEDILIFITPHILPEKSAATDPSANSRPPQHQPGKNQSEEKEN